MKNKYFIGIEYNPVACLDVQLMYYKPVVLLKFSLVSVVVGLLRSPERIINIDTYPHSMEHGFNFDQWTDNLSLQRAKRSSGLLLSLWALF